VSLGRFGRWPVIVLLATAAWTFVLAPHAVAVKAPERKVETRVQPEYPQLARTMHVAGTVRMLVMIAPSGTVQSVRAMGGHPLLVEAAIDAVKQWKFEPGPKETTMVMEFKFSGGM
jgi:TonB family protein